MKNKYRLVMYLMETTFCFVKEFKDGIDVVKNRFGYDTIDDIKGYEFEKIKLSELDGERHDIITKYHGKNVWLLMEE